MKPNLVLVASLVVFGCAHTAETSTTPAASSTSNSAAPAAPTADTAAPAAPSAAPAATVDGSGITGTVQGEAFASKVLLAHVYSNPEYKGAAEITIFQSDVGCNNENDNDKFSAVITLPMKKGYKVTFKDHSCDAAEGSDADDMYDTICFDQESFSLREFPESGSAEVLSVPTTPGTKGRVRITNEVGEKGSQLTGEADFLLCPQPKET